MVSGCLSGAAMCKVGHAEKKYGKIPQQFRVENSTDSVLG